MTEGDSFFVVFPSARSGVMAAVEGQRALAAADWPGGAEVRVRMGLHAGEAALAGGDLVGYDINRAARIASAAHGGQIVVSDAVKALAGGLAADGIELRGIETLTSPTGGPRR